MEEEKRYKIGDKNYFQRPLVLGQCKQLLQALKGVKIPVTDNIFTIVEALGDKLPELLAIVLQEEGTRLQDKDLVAIAAELDFAIEPKLILDIADDFFAGNEISSLLLGISERLNARLVKTIGTSSESYVSLSPVETSQDAMPSSGT